MNRQTNIPRTLQFALFLVGGLWLFAAHLAAFKAAEGFAIRFHLALYQPLMQQAFLLTLLLTGFAAINWTSTRYGSIRDTNALPSRPTARREWQQGAAFGWGMLLVTLIPIMLAGDLHPQFWLQPRSWALALLSLLTIALSTLAIEVAFRGYLFTRLVGAVNPTAATLLMSLLYAIASIGQYSTTRSSLAVFLFGILLSMAYLRTHALWLGWGLHFAWSAAMAIAFGLPVAGDASLSSLVLTNTSGSDQITGGLYGPAASLFAMLVVIVAMPLLYRMTRDYAWDYTHPEIIAAGYAMEVQAPPEHAAMEAAAPAPLVQILGTTSTNASTLPVIDEHLRKNIDGTDPS